MFVLNNYELIRRLISIFRQDIEKQLSQIKKLQLQSDEQGVQQLIVDSWLKIIPY